MTSIGGIVVLLSLFSHFGLRVVAAHRFLFMALGLMLRLYHLKSDNFHASTIKHICAADNAMLARLVGYNSAVYTKIYSLACRWCLPPMTQVANQRLWVQITLVCPKTMALYIVAKSLGLDVSLATI